MGPRVPSSQRKESAVQEIGEAGKYFSNVSVRELRAKENGATGTGVLWNVALVVNQSRSLLSYHARASGSHGWGTSGYAVWAWRLCSGCRECSEARFCLLDAGHCDSQLAPEGRT